MSSPTYDGQALFQSGPAMCEVGGATLRHAVHEPMQGHGVHVIAQGRAGRGITQRGSLIGDTMDALQAQIAAIESYVDGTARELVDEHERRWAEVVMLSFEPATPRRLGVRWQVNYRVTYRQVRT
ncbi:MAG: hypothetical protein WD118_07180 [Phycisphaeraceae bacterium]